LKAGVLQKNKNTRNPASAIYPLFEVKSRTATAIGIYWIALEFKPERTLNEYPTRSKIPEVKKVS
jgi:hypothetical protein